MEKKRKQPGTIWNQSQVSEIKSHINVQRTSPWNYHLWSMSTINLLYKNFSLSTRCPYLNHMLSTILFPHPSEEEISICPHLMPTLSQVSSKFYLSVSSLDHSFLNCAPSSSPSPGLVKRGFNLTRLPLAHTFPDEPVVFHKNYHL